MIDYHCVHHDVCNYTGFAVQDCAQCKFRRYPGKDFDGKLTAIANKDPRGLVGIWIKHEYAEYEGDKLVDNYECLYCGEHFKNETSFCPDCGKPLLTTYEAEQKQKEG